MNPYQDYLKKWSASKTQWVDVYGKVLSSGWFQWFASHTATGAKRSIELQRVWAYVAFGEGLEYVPGKPPGLEPNLYAQSFCVPEDRNKLNFFMCPSPQKMNEWKDAMCRVVNSVYQSGQQSMPTASQPPPYPADIGFGLPGPSQPPPPYTPPSAYPTQPGYTPDTLNSAYPRQPPPPAGAYPPYGTQPPIGYAQYTDASSRSSPYPRQPPPPAGAYPAYGQQPPTAYPHYVDSSGRPYEIVYHNGKRKKKRLGGLKNAAVGLASGLAGGYMASKLFGGWGSGWGCGPLGGFGGGFGRWGSWSSLSSLSWSD